MNVISNEAKIAAPPSARAQARARVRSPRFRPDRLASLHRILLLLFALVWSATVQASPADDPESPFDPDKVRWTRVQMTASKFFMSMDALVELETLDVQTMESRLITPLTDTERRNVSTPLALAYVTDGLGRRNETQLLLDGRSGLAFQRRTLRTGGSKKYRIYRFEDDGILRRTWRPNASEEKSSPDSWSRLSEETHPYPDSGHHPMITEASALIYLAAAARLDRPGDSVDILALASDQFYMARLVLRGPEEIWADYSLVDRMGASREIGRTAGVRISIQALPLDGQDHEDFELFGLTDLELILDPDTRAPLELRGEVEFLGSVAFRANRVTLAPTRVD